MKINTNTKVLLGSAAGLLVGIGATAIVMANVANADVSKNNKVPAATTTIETVTDTEGNEVMVSKIPLTSEKDIKEATDRVRNTLEEVRGKSIFLQVLTDYDKYDNYIYNNKGELIAQSADGNYTILMRSDKQSVKFNSETGTVSVNSMIDVMSTTEGAIKAMEDMCEGTYITHIKLEGDEEYGIYEYEIELDGDEACRKLFEPLGDEFADSIMEELKSYMEEGWEPHFVYSVTLDKNNQMGVSLDIIEDGNRYSNWVCNFYIETDNWELSEEWYSLDFTYENVEKMYELMDETTKMASEVVKDIDPAILDSTIQTDLIEEAATTSSATGNQGDGTTNTGDGPEIIEGSTDISDNTLQSTVEETEQTTIPSNGTPVEVTTADAVN